MELPQRKSATWRDFEPEQALIGAVLQQACRDALQTTNPALSQEAWEFLELCAPDVAERLRLLTVFAACQEEIFVSESEFCSKDLVNGQKART